MIRIDELLKLEAGLANRLHAVREEIKRARGDQPPPCWGTDDCSTLMLSLCPWRIDCGDRK